MGVPHYCLGGMKVLAPFLAFSDTTLVTCDSLVGGSLPPTLPVLAWVGGTPTFSGMEKLLS